MSIPNSVSIAMDTANGGVSAYGGYHRLFGGHSLLDFGNWSEFGPAYIPELWKDFVTPNGLPLPGVETLAHTGWISPSALQSWGALNVWEFLSGSICIGDSIHSLYQVFYLKQSIAPELLAAKSLSKLFSTLVLVPNPLVLFAGVVDLGILLHYLTPTIEIDFDPMPVSHLDVSRF